jgi:hypothetical protein
MAHFLVDFIRHQVAKGLQVLHANFQFYPDLVLLDKILGNRSGKHGLIGDERIGRGIAGKQKAE